MLELNLPNTEYFLVKLPLEKKIYDSLESWLSSEQLSYGHKRKNDFLAGRYCVIKSFEKLDIKLKELKVQKDHTPFWPKGFCGSISHSKSFAISIISEHYQSIGIDIEDIIPLERLENIQNIFINPEEKKLIETDHAFNGTLIFSAKEALYKTIYPLAGEFFGFQDATILSITGNTFKIKLHSEKQRVKVYNGVYQGQICKVDNSLVTVLKV